MRLVHSPAVASIIIALPVLAAFCLDLFIHHGQLAPYVAMRLEAADRILAGQVPYLDFFDWVQPLTLAYYSMAALLSEKLASISTFFSRENLSHIQGLIVLSGSLLLSVTILVEGAKKSPQAVKREIEQVGIMLPLAFALANYGVRFQFNDVQYLFSLCLLPWLVLRWLTWQEITVSPLVGILTGLFLGFGVCLDLPHLPIVLILECFYMLRFFRPRALLSYETVSLSLFILGDLLSFLFMDSLQRDTFFQQIMALRYLKYTVFDQVLVAYGNAPDRRDVLYLLSVSLIVAFLRLNKQSFLAPVSVCALLGMALYMMEAEGLSSSLVICSFYTYVLAALLVLSFVLGSAGRRLAYRGGFMARKLLLQRLVCCLLTIPVAFAFLRHTDKAIDIANGAYATLSVDNIPDVGQFVNDHSELGDNVEILADYPDAIYPMLTNLGRHQTGYLLWAKPLTLLDLLAKRDKIKGPIATFKSNLVSELYSEFQGDKAVLVMVHGNLVLESLEDLDLMEELRKNYKPLDVSNYFANNVAPKELSGLMYCFTSFCRRDQVSKK